MDPMMQKAQLLLARMRSEIGVYPHLRVEDLATALKIGVKEPVLLEHYAMLFGLWQEQRMPRALALLSRMQQEEGDCRRYTRSTVLERLDQGWEHEAIIAEYRQTVAVERQAQQKLTQLQREFGDCSAATEDTVFQWMAAGLEGEKME
jgi:uncharacterized protein (DUF433 family)